MAEHPIEGMMGVTMDKIRQMVDSNTIIGNPITVEGTIIIPVSRVTFGFASGGSDVGQKSTKDMFCTFSSLNHILLDYFCLINHFHLHNQ